ncbi:response regulator [bacterium]|nr:response regulator [bacterium]
MNRHGLKAVFFFLIFITVVFISSCDTGVHNSITQGDLFATAESDTGKNVHPNDHPSLVLLSVNFLSNKFNFGDSALYPSIYIFVLGILAITGLLHMLFYTYLPNEKSSLILSGLCLTLALYLFFGSDAFIIKKTMIPEAIGVVLSLSPFFFLIALTRFFYPEDFMGRIERFLILMLTAGILIALVLLFVDTVYKNLTAFLFPAIILCYFAVITIKAWIKKRNGSTLLASGLLILFSSGLLHDTKSFLPLVEYANPLGLAIFILSNSLVLLRRHLQSHTVFKTLSFELQKKESELEQKSLELAGLGRLKEEFLASVSGELQAPLQAVVSLTESLAQKFASSIPKEFSDSFQLVCFNCKRMSILIDNILDFTRLTHNRLHLNLGQFRVHSLVDSVIELSELDAIHRSIHLINKVSCSFPMVIGDKKRSYQVLYNLIENAIKFSNGGLIEISAVKDGNHAKISITDTGIGIEKQFQKTIFKDFEKLVHWEERQNTGLGLGLSIAKKLIEIQGGNIWLNSTVDMGSSFSFSLPLAECSSSSKESRTHSEVPGLLSDKTHVVSEENYCDSKADDSGFTRIWIIDDDPVNQQIVSGFLSSDHVRISSYYEESEPLENISSGNIPDLILLDVLMPQTSGFELCRKIRDQFSMTELPIIFLTAKNSISDLVEAFSLGANDFIVKPFLRDELVSRVNSQLHQSRINKNMISLRAFNHSIVNKRDAKSMVLEALNTIQMGISTSGISLFQDEKMIKVLNQDGKESSLEIAPPKDLFIEFDSGNESDLYICNKIPADHPLRRFYQNQTDMDITDSSVISVFLEDLENMNILVFRDCQNPGFSNYEIEYLKSIFHTMNTMRQNFRKLFSNTSLVDAVSFINKNLQEIVYIKSIHPYSQVFYNQDNNLTSKEVQISLQDIQAYFDEKNMLRIHRSYFINPNKILSVRKKNQIDFEVKIKTEPDEIQKLNIGRNYVNHFKKLYPNFF